MTVTTERVEFTSEGIPLIGDLRLPSEAGSLPALVFTGPFTGVRDQVVGTYADHLARDGYITLAFDHRGFGDSGGSRRQHEDPQGKLADLRDAVSFLSRRPEVDSDRIGLVGICLGGGYALRAAATDPRIAAVGCVAGGFNSPAFFRSGMGADSYRRVLTDQLQSMATEPDRLIPAVGTEGEVAMGGTEPYQYYGTERGRSVRWQNSVTAASLYALMTFDALGAAPLVAPTPLLIVHGQGDDYCSPKLAQAAYDAADSPKRLVWLDTDVHIDFYDNPGYVERAVSELVAHFTEGMPAPTR